jgi:hypothetical protein
LLDELAVLVESKVVQQPNELEAVSLLKNGQAPLYRRLYACINSGTAAN